MRILSRAVLLAAALHVAAPAFAAPPDRGHSRHFVAQQQDGPSLSEAVEMVRRKYRGRIVSAETHVSGNHEVHVIKVLTEDGKVVTERIRGRTRRG